MRSWCSPRVRGWPADRHAAVHVADVFPARAGMARSRGRSRPASFRVPRACGDGPSYGCRITSIAPCSPRVRGWPRALSRRRPAGRVFPACAGMVRLSPAASRTSGRVPRVCGDGPQYRKDWNDKMQCSPRVREWPGGSGYSDWTSRVFPARAEMARCSTKMFLQRCGVPRVCGDGPAPTIRAATGEKFSPRVRGWPDLHAKRPDRRVVSPARAGMARGMCTPAPRRRCVPRACGDGALMREVLSETYVCSPRVRGWPGAALRSRPSCRVFPACAGMDVLDRQSSLRYNCPRVRVGRSSCHAKCITAPDPGMGQSRARWERPLA